MKIDNMATLERYTVSESTVDDIIETLNRISEQGFGSHTLLCFDPDTDEWEAVTGFTYNHSNFVKLYTDES
jgi:hypothetical protein